MLRFYAAPFTNALAAVAQVDSILRMGHKMGAEVSDDDREKIRKLLTLLGQQLGELPFSTSLRNQADRLKASLDIDDGQVLSIRCEELTANVLSELESKVFLAVSERDAGLYENPRAALTEKAAAKFQEMMFDFEAAGRCRALGEPTAAVLHLMRVHEVLLRHLGKIAKIPVAKDKTIDFQECQKIIDQIRHAIAGLPSPKKAGAAAARKREFYNQICAYLEHIKDAWRTPAAHGRAKYDDREAQVIWENTVALMERMTSPR